MLKTTRIKLLTGLMLSATVQAMACPPGGGNSNYQSIDPNAAENYITNYQSRRANSISGYMLDIATLTNMARSASAVKMYNGLNGTTRIAIYVPVDANQGTVSGGAMFAQTGGFCPPNCDIISVSAASISKEAATNAVNAYNNGENDPVNAFMIYPAAITALKSAGVTNIRVSNALSTADNVTRYIIYTGYRADGSVAGCVAETGSSLCTKCGL